MQVFNRYAGSVMINLSYSSYAMAAEKSVIIWVKAS